MNRVARRTSFCAAAIALTLVAALLPSTGCGGDSGGVVPTNLLASFAPSGTAAAQNGVRLRAVSAIGDTVVLEVVIGGVSTSSDIYSFAFDVLLSNASVATYVGGTAVAGNALTPAGGQTLSVQAATSGNRTIVGVTKVGGGLGNGIPAGESVVVRLSFRATGAGMTNVTFSGVVTAQNPTGAPVALDSAGAILASVQFDTAPAVIIGSY